MSTTLRRLRQTIRTAYFVQFAVASNWRGSRTYLFCRMRLPVLLCQFSQLLKLGCYIAVASPAMGDETTAAILDSVGEPRAVPVAGRVQRVQRTVAEEAIEVLRMVRLVAGEKLTLPMLKKRVSALLQLHAQTLFVFHIPAPSPWFKIARWRRTASRRAARLPAASSWGRYSGARRSTMDAASGTVHGRCRSICRICR